MIRLLAIVILFCGIWYLVDSLPVRNVGQAVIGISAPDENHRRFGILTSDVIPQHSLNRFALKPEELQPAYGAAFFAYSVGFDLMNPNGALINFFEFFVNSAVLAIGTLATFGFLFHMNRDPHGRTHF